MKAVLLPLLVAGQVSEFSGTVTDVHDGDTARVEKEDGTEVRVRFLLCDASEIDQPHGIQVRDFVRDMCVACRVGRGYARPQRASY